jgi:hypothetical protein
MDLGVGYNAQTGELLSAANCLEDPHDSVVRNPLFNQTERAVTVIRNAAELAAALEIGATFSFLVGPVTVNVNSELVTLMKRSSESLFALVVVDRRVAEYRLERPTLARSLGDIEPEAFARRCGDHFVQSIVTGARYVGLIQITARTAADNARIASELTGRFAPLGVAITGGFSLALRQLASEYRVRIHAVSQGLYEPNVLSVDAESLDDYGMVAQDFDDYGSADLSAEAVERQNQALLNGDLERFFSDINAFYAESQHITAAADYREHALLATIESYDSLLGQGGQSTGLSPSAARRQELAEAVQDYSLLAEQIETVLRFPDDYVPPGGHEADDGSSLSPTVPQGGLVDIDGLTSLAARVRHGQRVLEHLAMVCSRQRNPRCPAPAELEALDVVSPDEVRRLMPERRIGLPDSCGTLKTLHGVGDDGEYTLYLGGRQDQPYRAYCEGMGDGDDSHPAAFLQLGPGRHNGCASGSRPPFNYGMFSLASGVLPPSSCNEEATTGSWGEWSAVFDRLPLHITPDYVVVADGDALAGSLTPRFGAATTCTEHPFASTNAVVGGWHPEKMANIDLRETPWRIAPWVGWDEPTAPEVIVGDADLVDFEEAVARAADRGGELVTVVDEAIIESLLEALEQTDSVWPIWLGLRCDVGDDRYRWLSGLDYAYAPWLPHPHSPCETPQCVALHADGLWEALPCETQAGFAVQYGLETSLARVSPDGRLVDLYLSSLDESCVTLEPQRDLVLQYAGEWEER